MTTVNVSRHFLLLYKTYTNTPKSEKSLPELSEKTSTKSPFQTLRAYLPEIHIIDKQPVPAPWEHSRGDVEKGSYGTFEPEVEIKGGVRDREVEKGVLLNFLASLLVVGFLVVVGVVGVGVFL